MKEALELKKEGNDHFRKQGVISKTLETGLAIHMIWNRPFKAFVVFKSYIMIIYACCTAYGEN
jgi:hypothetical protein